MGTEEKIRSAYASAHSYPELAAQLLHFGIQTYTVEVSTGTILYRFDNGIHHLHLETLSPRAVAPVFNEDLTIQAIRNNQEGKSDYATFMNEIARAGVRMYEATLAGTNRRVTYIGFGGSYEEAIPIVVAGNPTVL